MSHDHRPRASDFDPPTQGQPASPPPLPSSHHHHHQRQQERRPSPNYERGNQLNRLTPEESLDRHHHHHQQKERPREDNYSNGGYRQGGRDDFFEKRRLDRANAPVIGLWPKSPTQAYGEEKKKKKGSSNKKEERQRSSKDKKKHKSSKAKHYRSSDDDSETERSDDYHRSHKKHKSRGRDKKYDSESEDENSEDERARRSQKRKGKSKSVELEGRKEEEDEGVWMEKEIVPPANPATTVQIEVTAAKQETLSGPSRPITTTIEQPTVSARAESLVDDEADVGEVGPMPYNHATGKAMDPKEFGRALRPGEGSAMAAFIEAGERIPRRGEIGLTGTEIEKFENVGYVMSGSRHRRMNAVRIRKENQVISAEEKRGILKMQAEEKAKREGQIISSFRELVDTKLQETG